jgi:MerR family mercuric resistance operon transcriptional regulator
VDEDKTCADVREQAEAKITDIEKRIRSLQRMKRALRKVTRSCSGSGPTSECPILEALDGKT